MRNLLRKCLDFVVGNLARRTFAQFVLLAVAPLIVTGVVTIHQVTGYMTNKAISDLESNAKGYGLQMHERLTLAAHALQQSRADNIEMLTQPLIGTESDQYFDAIELVDSNRREMLAGDPQRSTKIDPAILLQSDRRLWVIADQGGKDSVYLTVRNQTQAGPPIILVAALNQGYLWQPSEMSRLYSVCVRDSSNNILFCSPEENQSIATVSDDDAYLSGDWNLFMQGAFGVGDWNISAKRSRAESLAAVTMYKRTLLVMMLGVLSLIALLSSITLRRSHRPLQRIIDATRNIASGTFDKPLNVTSGDEYQELAKAINEMSSQIGRQFQTLSVLSQIDRCILKSPSLQPIIETVLTRARDVLICDMAAVLLRDLDSDTQGYLYLVGSDQSQALQLSRVDWRSTDAQRDDTDDYLIDAHTPGANVLQPLWVQGIEQCLVMPVGTKLSTSATFVLGFRQATAIDPAQRELARDVADRLAVALTSVEREQALFHQAHYDHLTQLPNRLLFKDRLEQELTHARLDSSSVGVLFIDLDRFKNINDSLGHTAGDQVLTLAAARLAGELRDVDTIARLGGDEFTVVLPQVRGLVEVAHACDRLLRSLSAPFVLDGVDYVVGASIGVALYPQNGTNVEELLRNADTAMYRAKAAGKGSYAFYEESMNEETRERVWIEGQLRQALGNDQLVLHFQPQVELASGNVIGAEVLLRWAHPERGMIDPDQFIHVAEDTGLIVPIGEWVIFAACRQVHAWRANGIQLESISANVSVSQIASPGFVAFVERTLREFQIPPSVLELELTESTLASDIAQSSVVLLKLSNLGVRLAIDDFGTGYSSLSYLQRLPFHTLKIDRTFIPTKFDGNDHVICDAILALAASLHKTVVAEGVETSEQLSYLRSKHCHVGQGYFLGKPVSASEFAAEHLMARTQQSRIGRVAAG